MSENQIKVGSIEELIAKSREFVDSQGGENKVEIGNSSTSTGYYIYTPNGLVQSSKEGIAIELKGQNNSSVEFLLESEGEIEAKSNVNPGKLSPKLLQRALAELNKIIPDTLPKPKNKTSDKKNDFQYHSFSSLAVPCSSLEEIKKQIRDFYQKNREEINKKPEFSRWVEITEIGLFSNYSEVGKNGETITSGPHNTATILLKGANQTEDGKIINQWITLLLKVKTEEWGLEDINWPENELKKCWNTLVEQKESLSAKNMRNEIEQIRKEISKLENDPQTKNNSERQKVLERKKNELNELLKKGKNANASSHQLGNNNLVFIIIISGIASLVSVLFLVKLLQKRKKVIK